MEIRAKRITAALDLRGTGIEYGPLHRTIVPKGASAGVKYVDYASRSYLVEKYSKDPNVDTNLIPEIDIVTGGETVDKFIPANSLDYVIASHVMEHVPDMIGWLRSNLEVLKPGGRIAVAFPDRRYCFDLKKTRTMFSDLVAAWLEERKKPTFQQLCDHFMNIANAPNPPHVWNGQITPENADLKHPRQQAVQIVRGLLQRSDYVDCHCWKLADHECLDVLNDIKNFVPLPFEVLAFSHTQRNSIEFYFTLEKV